MFLLKYIFEMKKEIENIYNFYFPSMSFKTIYLTNVSAFNLRGC